MNLYKRESNKNCKIKIAIKTDCYMFHAIFQIIKNKLSI